MILSMQGVRTIEGGCITDVNIFKKCVIIESTSKFHNVNNVKHQ
jgi:hypothetical protein